MTTDGWVSLFSGGKDSSWALHRALESGRTVTRLVTVHPAAGSYLYHVPATEVAALAAESIGIPLVEVEASMSVPTDVDSSRQGDRELEPLERALRGLTESMAIDGLTAGAVESRFQYDRLVAMADRLELALFAPLWQADPYDQLAAMLAAGFEIVVIAVAADGLDVDWLGRTLDHAAIDDLRRLEADHGVHPLGEGGEFETLVTDGPHMDRPIVLSTTEQWDGARGELRIEDARLG